MRNVREHARWKRRLREGAGLHNALALFDRGIRRHNRRCFLRHACDWKPSPGDFQGAGATPSMHAAVQRCRVNPPGFTTAYACRNAT